MPEGLTYDSQFEKTPPNPWEILKTARKSQGIDISYGVTDYGQDITNDSYIHQDYDWYNAFDVNEERAQMQPTSHKIARGIGRVGVEIAANILQMPGYIGGAVAGAINTLSGGEGSMDMFVNNAWVDSLESVKEYYNNELAPVHVKNAVRDGDLLANISSVDFWATEGASGLAFLISAFAPGAAVTKFGTGLKLTRALGKSNLFGKGSGLKLLQKTDKLAKKLGVETTENLINIAGATVANTLYEAGVEADGALQSLESQIEAKYQSGEINYGQYLELKQGAPKQAAKVFRDNLGILLLPNMMMSKALFGKALPKKVLESFENVGGRISPTVKALTGAEKVGKVVSPLAKAFGSEAVIEEGGQMTSEMYHTEGYIEDFLSDGENSKSWGATYMDMLKSTEGQKAMFLGTVFGTGAYAFGNHRQGKAQKTQRAQLAELMTSGVNFYEAALDGIYEKDDDGNIVFEDGKAKIDHAKVADLGSNIDFINKINAQKSYWKMKADQGEPGAQEKVDILDRTITNNMLYSFVHAGEEGITVLKNYLENSPAIDNLLKQINNNTEGATQTKGQFVNKLVTEAETIRQDLEFYKNYGEFKNKLVDNANDNPYYEKYGINLRNKYAAVKSNLRYLEEAKKEKEAALVEAKKTLRVTEDAKREDAYNELKDMTVKDLKAKAAELGMTGVSNLRKDKLIEFIQGEMIFDEEQNDLVDNLQTRVTAIDELIEDNNKELKGISNAEKQKVAYAKFKANEQAREKAEAEAAELDAVLDEIRATTNKTEMSNVSIPEKFKEGNASLAVTKVKQEQEEKFKTQRKEASIQAQEDNKEELSAEEETKAEQVKKAKYIADNFEKGEQVNTEGLDVPEGYDVFEASNDESIALSNEEGETVIVPINTAWDSLIDEEDEARLEPLSTVDEYTPSLEEENPNMIAQRDDARIAITDNKTSGPVKPLNKTLNEAYKFELSPQDKRKDYPVEISDWRTEKQKTTGKARWDKAIDRYNKEGVTDENFQDLLDNLPLGIKLLNGSTGPIQTKPEKGDLSIYQKTTEKVRKAILSELRAGTKVSDLSISIKGQYPGRIQIETDENGRPVENNIKDLYYFRGEVDNITETDFLYTNENGTLLNIDGTAPMVTRQDFPPGELYLKIYTADGRLFPLKLNTKKISEKEADFLHGLFLTRANEFQGSRLPKDALGKQAKLSKKQRATFKREFPAEFDIIVNQLKSENDLNIKHVTDFFLYDNTTNLKSRVKFVNGDLKIGTTSFTKEELTNNKQGFIDVLTDVKRRQITVKPHKKNKSYNVNLTNKAYRDYLINNRIINTNAKLESEVFKDEGINDPIFKERTTMFLDIRSLKVNGKFSDYNPGDTVSFQKMLFGETESLKRAFPALFEKGLELDEAAGVYLTAEDRKAVETFKKGPPSRTAEEILEFKKRIGKDRVSSLNDYIGVENEASNTGKVRGDITDVLIREFFSPLQEINNNDRFAQRGMELLEIYAKKHGVRLLIDKEWFKEKLWPVVKRYAKMFDDAGYTVYADEFPVMLKMGGKEYAGTGDLLIYDNKNKVWGLIDIKTSTKNREKFYDDASYKYGEKDAKQQNAYKEAFYQTAKIPIAWTKIMPLHTPNGVTRQYKNYLGKNATVGIGKVSPKRETLDDHLITVSNKKDIFELTGNNKEAAPGKINVEGIVPGENLAPVDENEIPEEAMLSGSLMGDLGSIQASLSSDVPQEEKIEEEPQQKTTTFSKEDVIGIPWEKNGVPHPHVMKKPVIDENQNPVSGGEIFRIVDGKYILVTQRDKYDELIAFYNDFASIQNERSGGLAYIILGPKTTTKFYNFMLANNGAGQPSAGIPKASTNIAKQKKATPEVKKEIKENEKKLKKTVDTKEELLNKITKKNALGVFKSLQANGLINASNLKVVGALKNKSKGDDAKFVKDVITHLLDNQQKALSTIKNCI